MQNAEILNLIRRYEETAGTNESIFQSGMLPDAERDFVMRDSNAFLFGNIEGQGAGEKSAG